MHDKPTECQYWRIFHSIMISYSVVSLAGGISREFRIYCCLRSKRFRGVWEQRKTGERDFRCFSRAKNGARAKKRKREVGEFLPHPSPLFPFLALAPFFARAKHRKSRFSVLLCTLTPRKRLLRWINLLVHSTTRGGGGSHEGKGAKMPSGTSSFVRKIA